MTGHLGRFILEQGAANLLRCENFYPNAPSYISQSMDSLYHRREQEKHRRMTKEFKKWSMLHSLPSFCHLSGCMGMAIQTAYKRLASLLAETKRETLQYNHQLH